MEARLQKIANDSGSGLDNGGESRDSYGQNTLHHEGHYQIGFRNQMMENFMNHDSQEFSDTLKQTPQKLNLDQLHRVNPQQKNWTPRESEQGPPPVQQMRTIFANYSPIQLTENTNSMDQSESFSNHPDIRPEIPVELPMETTVKTMQKPMKKKKVEPKEDLIEGIYVIGPDKSELLSKIDYFSDSEMLPQ